MATGHAGSWWGLPDFGITEKIADTRDALFGASPGSARDPNTGGSQFIPDSQDNLLHQAAWNMISGNNNQTSTTPTPVAPPTNNQNQNQNQNTGGGQKVAAPTSESEQARRLRIWREQGNSGDVPVGWNPDSSGGSSPDWGNMLNEAYAPFVQALQGFQDSIMQGKAEDEALVGKQYSDTQSNLDNQQKTEQENLDEQGRQLWESFRKSFGTGAQNYANRLRGLVNLYGMGNSTGQTMAQLLANKQAEVEGGLQEQRLQGERAIALEGVKLSRYISDKKNQLDTWKMQTMNSIAQNVRDKLNQINSMRGEAEINKTNAKIQLLQQTINMQKQVEAQDKAFRQNLAQWAVQQVANVQQDNFDVASVPKVYYNTLNQLNALAANNPAQSVSGQARTGRVEDELRGIVG